jgi:hypothetical protein
MFRIHTAGQGNGQGARDEALQGEMPDAADASLLPPTRLPSIEDAAADIRRLTVALQERSAAAPDNVVELAALNVDLRRASAVWRRLVPTGLWS